MSQNFIIEQSTAENVNKTNTVVGNNLSNEEVIKERRREKCQSNDTFENLGKIEPMDILPDNYHTETVDFPESPKYRKFTRYSSQESQERIIEDEMDGFAKNSSQSEYDQNAKKGKLRYIPFNTEGTPLYGSFTSDKEEYFEDDLVTGKLDAAFSISDVDLSSEDEDIHELSADQLHLVAKQGLKNNILQDETPPMDSIDYNFSPGISLTDDNNGCPRNSETYNISQKLEKECNISEGFLFDEKASDEAPDSALVQKVKSCFDMEKIKDIYILSGRLQDILSPIEIEEIVTHSDIYSEFIDDDVIEMLSVVRQEKMNICGKIEKINNVLNSRKTIPVSRDKLNLDVIDDIKIRAVFEGQKKSGEKIMANTVETKHQYPLKETSNLVPTGDIRAFFEESLVKSTSTLKMISPNDNSLSINTPSVFHNEIKSSTFSKQPLLLNVKNLEEESFKKLKEQMTSTPILKADGTVEMTKVSSLEVNAVIDNTKCEKKQNQERILENNEETGAVNKDCETTKQNFEEDNPIRLNSTSNLRRKKKISVNRDILASDEHDEDQNSLSSLSNKSDADVFSPVDDIVTPDDIETPDDFNESVMEGVGSSLSDLIPEFSAAEELEEERSWKTCIVGGVKRKIDMKVIEPYKKVLSHGGYFGPTRNAIIVFSACYLPDRSRRDYDYVMDNLFLYVLITLDQLVAEDYVLVYLHGATQRSNMPSFGWLKRCYQMIDRRLRKNLKGLYLVHPTFWLKTIVIMTRPFVSTKFSRKLQFVSTLQELSELIPMDHVCIPDKVKEIEFRQVIQRKKKQMKNKNIGPRQTFIPH